MEKSIISLEDSLDTVFGLSSKDWKLYSPLTLAYIGDAAYEMVVRSIYVKRSNMQTQKLHQKVTACVKAQTQAKMIQLLLPELTEERRKELVKDVKKKGEAAKVAVRNVRRDANDAFKKLGKQDVSEDEIKDLEDAVQKLTDKFVKKIDAAVDTKAKEILTV